MDLEEGVEGPQYGIRGSDMDTIEIGYGAGKAWP